MDKTKDKVIEKSIKIIILNRLRNDIFKTFKKDALKVYSLIEELNQNPNKGKILGHVGSISIRELKYKSFRFYFILDAYKLSLFNNSELKELLVKFIEMSKKNNQKKMIQEIRFILSNLDFDDIL